MKDFESQALALLPQLGRYARSLSRNRHDAEDLLQDSLELALRGKHTWRGVNLKAWLTTIMTRAFYAQRNRCLPLGSEIDIADLELPDGKPEVDPLEQKRIAHALAGLAPEFRSVLLLVVIEGHSYMEVAEILDVPLGTVMSRLSRARRQFASRLEFDNVIHLRVRS